MPVSSEGRACRYSNQRTRRKSRFQPQFTLDGEIWHAWAFHTSLAYTVKPPVPSNLHWPALSFGIIRKVRLSLLSKPWWVPFSVMKISRMFWSSSTKPMTSSRTRKYMHLKSPKTLGHHPFPWQDGDDEGTQAMMGWWWDRTIFSAYDSADRFGFGRLAPFWTSCRRVACPILKHSVCTEGHGAPGVPCNQGWHFSALPGLEGLMKWQEGWTKCLKNLKLREKPHFPNFHPQLPFFFLVFLFGG